MSKLRNDGIITDEEYVGKPTAEAIQYAIEGGFYCRIIEKDGNEILHDDPSSSGNTLLFSTQNDVVTKVAIS